MGLPHSVIRGRPIAAISHHRGSPILYRVFRLVPTFRLHKHLSLRRGGYLDRPDKSRKLSGHGSHGRVHVLALEHQPFVFPVQPVQGAIRGVNHVRGASPAALFQPLAGTGVLRVMPCALDQQPPQVPVPGLRDSPPRFRFPLLEFSLGTNPRYDMNAFAFANRRKSPISQTTASAIM